MVTGKRPDEHGIINNNLPAAQGGQRYFSTKYLKVPTLWDAAKKQGLKTAAIHWPVTVDAQIDFNLPEYFQRRAGGGMDFASMASASTPGLIEKITQRYPSFPVEWVDDRVRTLATVYVLKQEKADLILLHLVDHDSAAHETGPFSTHAKATLEHQDELLGQILAAMPKNMVLAIVSDHGFERSDRAINPRAKMAKAGIQGEVEVGAMLMTTNGMRAAEFLRSAGIGREIPAAEWKRITPAKPVPLAAFEPNLHEVFTTKADAPEVETRMHGEHGYWPLRNDFRSTFLLWGNGVARARLGELDMLSLAGRFARILDIPFGKD
jgi:predicted AlkP superfamily pyrophosphatase or phosphodiesterase